MDIKNEIDILKDISKKLDKVGISYMLTGSLAMNYYAQPRMTRDIDIVIELDIEKTDSFIDTFKHEYYISPEGVKEAIVNYSMFNIIHNDSVIKVDFIIKKNLEYREVEFSRRKKIKIDDFHIYIVSKEDLIISKFYWIKDEISELQLKDIKNLLKTGCDKDYLFYWLKKLNLYSLMEELVNEGHLRDNGWNL